MLLLALLACQESTLPDGVLVYDVEVTAADIDEDGIADNCDPTNTEGWQDSFEYAVDLAVDADGTMHPTLYVDGVVLASGSMTDGRSMDYETVVMEQQTDKYGLLRWQLFGNASFDSAAGTDACVEGEHDWSGKEWFEIVSAEDDALVGCTYEMTTTGTVVELEE